MADSRCVRSFRGKLARGFTLVELLVVIAIIGILIALLLPAVQAAREAARRTQCANNLKEMGLAVNTYISAKKQLPPGKVGSSGDQGGGTCSTNEWSNWALEILPYMDEIGLFKQYDFTKDNGNAANLPVLQSFVKTQACPTDPNPSALYIPEVTTGDPPSMSSSYRAVTGRGWATGAGGNEAYWDSPKAAAGDNMSAKDRGPLSVIVTSNGYINGGKANCYMSGLASSPVKVKQIIDGTSKTLMIGEYTTVTRPSGSNTWNGKTYEYSRSAFWANSVFGLNCGSISLYDTGVGTGCRANPLTCNSQQTGITLDPDYNKCATEGPWAAANFPQPCRRTFTGYHSGGSGINFVAVDGSIHSLTNLADIRILAAMATIAGGETPKQP
jgi:prepilin-type N-terminal cleavage/methylation domain-containing protein